MADLRGRGLEVGVDEDVAAGRGDEVGGEVAAADVVEVAGDPEGGDRRGPVPGDLGGERGGGHREEEEEGEGDAAHDADVSCPGVRVERKESGGVMVCEERCGARSTTRV